MRGPATVVEGIADAAAFAQAVIGKKYEYDIPAEAYPAEGIEEFITTVKTNYSHLF